MSSDSTTCTRCKASGSLQLQLRDTMKISKCSPLTSDATEQMFKHEGPLENTPEAIAPEKSSGFSYRQVLGEIMCCCVTCRPDAGHAATTLSKFSAKPSECHHKQLKNVAKHLRSTAHWGTEFIHLSSALGWLFFVGP